jgi:long-chain acyl-CoA synthetase
MFLVPAMLRKILDHPDFSTRDHTSLTMLIYGAAPMPAQLITRALADMPTVGFANTWGQTETLGGITLLDPDDHRHPMHRHSVGRPVPGVQMRVLDPATGAELDTGEVGELQTLSSQNVTAGWHGTGDLGHVDPDGYVYLSGRMSDVINRGGEKVGPVEVEDVLRAHPQVADVAVVGVPDDVLGQRIGAAIVAGGDLDAQALQQWCEGRLAKFKTPERVVLVDAIPYSQLGKVDRKAVMRLITDDVEGDD